MSWKANSEDCYFLLVIVGGTTEVDDVLIIGAGPAGLALGYELKRRRVSFQILECGSGVGESWRRMPTNLKLVSPWKANYLPGTKPSLYPPNHEVSRGEFHHYLKVYAEENGLPVTAEVRVSEVTKRADGLFQVRTSRGDRFARLLVNATGYFSNPFIPTSPGAAESNVPRMHVADYHDPDNVRRLLGRSNGRVLIVGKRLSAGQTMVELVDAGFEVAISHRTPIEFGAGPFGWWIFFRLLPSLEAFKLKLQGNQARGFDVRMPGGRARHLIRSGAVKTFPSVRQFAGSEVVFEDGRKAKPDLVLYATGFCAALKHLESLAPELGQADGPLNLRDLESVSVPGLFLLGLDHGRNFQSRFIRGIRKDAGFLAERLRARLSEFYS